MDMTKGSLKFDVGGVCRAVVYEREKKGTRERTGVRVDEEGLRPFKSVVGGLLRGSAWDGQPSTELRPWNGVRN